MKKISETQITNIMFNNYNQVDDITGDLIPSVAINFNETIPCKNRNTDKQEDRNVLKLSIAQLEAKLYAASPVCLGYRRAKRRSLTEEDCYKLMKSAEKVTVISSRYEAGEVFEDTTARFWGINYELRLEFDNVMTSSFTRTEEEEKAAAKASLLAVLK